MIRLIGGRSDASSPVAATERTSLRSGCASAYRWCIGGAGFLRALAVLTRPSSLGLVVLLWLAALAFGRLRWAAVRVVVLWAVMLVAALLPWGLRNRAVLGSYAWLSTNGGVTLSDGQGPQATGASDQSFLADMGYSGRFIEVVLDRQLRVEAIRQMRRDPWRVVSLAGVKFLRHVEPDAERRRVSQPVARPGERIHWAAVLLGAAVGTWRLRRRPRVLVLLWMPVVYVTLVHCIYVGSLRYRVPVMPFVEILAAAAFAASLDSRDRRHDSELQRTNSAT